MEVLGIRVDCLDCEGAFQEIERWRTNGEKGYVVLTNPHSIMTCRRDSGMKHATASGRLVLADGVGVVLAARILFGRTERRSPGPDLMAYTFNAGQAVGMRHFLCGGRPEVLTELASRLRNAFPEAVICGEFSPPFRKLTDEESRELAARINLTKPDIVWVGLGAPKQEKWMAEMSGLIQAPAMIGVGAAFDFLGGSVPRAPRWATRHGVEWAFRLAQEPVRLWRRSVDSVLFLALVCGQKVGWVD